VYEGDVLLQNKQQFTEHDNMHLLLANKMLLNNLISEHVYVQMLKVKHYQQLLVVDQGQ
jgi:hypothetical protein